MLIAHVGSLAFVSAVQAGTPSSTMQPLAYVELAALTLHDAIRVAQRHAGGKVLSATSVQAGDTTLYRIKLIQGNGRIVTIVVDGNTGSIIEG